MKNVLVFYLVIRRKPDNKNYKELLDLYKQVDLNDTREDKYVIDKYMKMNSDGEYSYQESEGDKSIENSDEN